MIHGGDIYRNDVKLDFSVSINPLGLPDSVRSVLEKTISNVECYPDIKNERLIESLAKTHSIIPSQIVLGNGSSEIFMAIAHALKPKKVLLPVPCFNGYSWATDAVDAVCDPFLMRENTGFVPNLEIQDIINKDIDMLFLANPNNPTGRYIEKNILISIISKCKEKNVNVVLDECFMELSDNPIENSLIHEAINFKNLIIVRSFTKTFAIPGLRLGYAVCADTNKLNLLRKHLPEWNVSLPASFAGMYALKEIDYLVKSRKLIIKERKFLKENLNKLGIEVYPSNTTFLLIYSEKELYENLLKKGILIRDCSDYLGLTGGYYRIAIKDRESNEKLLEAIKEIS